jgi:radical SAM protein with 4Fe4S-binding SPASM domain
MTIEISLSEIQQNYQCLDTIYLSDFFLPNGESRLYNALKKIYQSSYEENQRIIVVRDCTDVYDYQDLPGRAITALQKYASQIDISNFFILILSGEDIESELAQARKLYSTDQCSMGLQLIDGLPTSRKLLATQDTFCVLPWIHLYVGTDGNVLPCCVADHQFPMGNINNHGIDTIAKSEQFNRLRTNMINGKRTKECSRCYQQEDAGLRSPRISHNKNWPNISVDTVDASGEIDQFRPVYLDIRLSNICNLKCRMCSGYFSSAIAQEEAELFGNTESIKLSLRLPQRKLSLIEILKYVPTAEKIYFAGGEPLLSSEHYEILQSLIECGNTNLKISYNTNFTTLQYRDINVLDLWRNFSNVSIGASLDAQGAVAEYVRHGTQWSVIESNLKLLQSQCPHVKFTVTSSVGLLNAQSLIDLQQDWHNLGHLDISNFVINAIVGPAHLTVRALPQHHKHRMELSINDHIQWCRKNQANLLANQWQELLNYMLSADHSHHLDEFKRLTTMIDTHRKESLSIAIPELKDLL